MLFSNGADAIPVTAFLSPLFLLRFVRLQRASIGLPTAYLVLVAAFMFQFRGMVPIPGVGYYIFVLPFGLTLVLPYVIDRWLTPRLTGLAAALVFPATFVCTEYGVSFGPYGTWGSVAYSQAGDLPLLQLLSVTGIWGITFLVTAFASVGNEIWQAGMESKPARHAVTAYIGTVLIVVVLGGARLVVFPPTAQTVRVASVSKRTVQPALRGEEFNNVIGGTTTAAELEDVRAAMGAVNRDLLERVEREAAAGAKVVFWGEANAVVLKTDEPGLIKRASELATRYGTYLGLALGTWNPGKSVPLENKFVLIKPDGQVAWEYFKARPVPGSEAAITVVKDGKLRSLDTLYGRVSTVICYDGDFPHLLSQAGALGADVVLDPANDWRAIDPLHTQMASYRAIEQGFNLVRHTSQGFSAAYDYQGHVLAQMDDFHAIDQTMVAQVPVKGVRTFYGILGDWFAWACCAALVGLILLRRRGSVGKRA